MYEGKSVFLALQQYRWNYNVVRQAVSISKEDQKPEVNPWLSQYGIELDPTVLMDVNHQSLTVREADNPMSALMGGGVTLNLPLHIMISQDTMNRKVSIASNLSPLFYLWGSALKLQPEVLGRHQLEHSGVVFDHAHGPGPSPLMPNSPPMTCNRRHKASNGR